MTYIVASPRSSNAKPNSLNWRGARDGDTARVDGSAITKIRFDPTENPHSSLQSDEPADATFTFEAPLPDAARRTEVR
jgi:hypothetical protein